MSLGLFKYFYGIGGLTGDMDIFQKIKSWMENEIEENPYNLLFNTNSFVVEVKHRNMWPYEEDFLETIDFKITGSFQRLESFRAEQRALLNFRGPGSSLGLARVSQESRGSGGVLDRVLGRLNQESRGSGGEIEEESEEEIEEESEEEEPKINTEQTFKEDECVICLTNPPNVLFCNCGLIAICVECDKVKSLKDCPMCKTENTIKRTI